MRKLLIAAALLGAGPALAQNSFTTTQNPPAGRSSESTVQPSNSMPATSGTEHATQQPGSRLGETRTTGSSHRARAGTSRIVRSAPPVSR